jgi:hypothetical protein
MRTVTLRLLGLFLCLLSATAFADGKPYRVTYTSKDNFESVKSAITDAITGQGLVINNTSHIGEMLERTGKDLGGAKRVFLNAESYEFCSATVSRKTMEADPHNIVFYHFSLCATERAAENLRLFSQAGTGRLASLESRVEGRGKAVALDCQRSVAVKAKLDDCTCCRRSCYRAHGDDRYRDHAVRPYTARQTARGAGNCGSKSSARVFDAL